MTGRDRAFGAPWSLTRQIMILVAVAIFSTQFVDLVVTQSLPPTTSGITMGGALLKLQRAIKVIEAAAPGEEETQLRHFSDRRLTFRLLRSEPAALAPTSLNLSRILRIGRLTFGGDRDDFRLIQLGPVRELHLPPPRSAMPTAIGDYPTTPSGVRIGPATYDILKAPGRPWALAVRTSRGWLTIQDAEHGERIWLRRAIPDLGIAILLILPMALWVGSRIGSRLRGLAGAIEKAGAAADVPAVEEGGPRDVRLVIRAFNQMQARIRTLLADRSMMMAAVSHDVRTPLARMRFRVAYLPADVRAGVTSDIEEIDELVDALLSLNRADHLPQRMERFDLGALAQSIVDELADAGAGIVFEGEERVPMLGDLISTKRIISNLVQNALKYASGAKVTLHRSADAIELAVEDEGSGIPPHMTELVFEPFRRLEASRNRSSGGSGMGLAIARHLARKAGGELVLDQAYAKGARFVLTLPADRVTAA